MKIEDVEGSLASTSIDPVSAKKKLQERVKILRKSYAQGLPSRIQEIEWQWRILLKKWDSRILVALERMVHNLHGSGATMGFPSISKSAYILGMYLRSIRKHAIESKDIDQTRIQILLVRLRNAATEAPQSIS